MTNAENTAASRPLTFDRLISEKQRVERHVYVPLSDIGIQELGDANVAAQMAEMTGQDVEAARKRVELAEELVRDNSAHFHFRSIGRRRYQELLEQHPASEAQRKATPPLVYDIDGLRPHLISRTLVSPALSVDEVVQLSESEEWNDAEIQALFDAAVAVNTHVRALNLGN